MNFAEPVLVAKYGSWAKVQVAFYDFLFETAFDLCAAHFNQQAMAESMVNGWGDGEWIYERAIVIIEKKYKTPETAWETFLEKEIEDSRAGAA